MSKSHEQFVLANKYIPGGVNSPVRAFKSVGMEPVFIQWGCGSHIWDIDGKEYIDYVGSWGPLLFGHSKIEIVDAIKTTAMSGTTFGAPTVLEVELAKLVCDMVPSVEMVRFVNSGTEAVASAIRLARAFTGRNKIIKFAGCYHGCVESLLVEAGSGVATLGLPGSPGIPESVTKDSLILDFNHPELVKEAFKIYKDEIAAVILEPVIGNAGCILPIEGYLKLLRDLCSENNSLLIFDEVMTGFRLSAGGAQELFNIMPDLTTMGKIIGGGLPVGAYGGRRDIMQMIAPSGPVYQAGTLSGNPIAMAAGIAMLNLIKTEKPYKMLNSKTEKLCAEMKNIAIKKGISLAVNNIGSMFSVFFTDKKVFDYQSAKTSDVGKFAHYFKTMLENGTYLPPSQFEANFMSTAHSDDDISKTLEAFEKSI